MKPITIFTSMVLLLIFSMQMVLNQGCTEAGFAIDESSQAHRQATK